MIRILTPPEAEAAIDDLAEILRDCVEGGAMVNFMLPYSHADALGFWRKALAAQQRGELVLFGGYDTDGHLSGTVSLGLDVPPNQPHRAEVKKMLVHRRARRQGLARRLMLALHTEARRLNRHLLVLDTGQHSEAEPLYQALGYSLLGVMPAYSLPPQGGTLQPCSFYYKFLDAP